MVLAMEEVAGFTQKGRHGRRRGLFLVAAGNAFQPASQNNSR